MASTPEHRRAADMFDCGGALAIRTCYPSRMSDIVSLRTVRKQKARADKAVAAERNRRLHGRTKAEKQLDAAEKARAERQIEGHKRDE
jgi:hypothetical protein